LYSSVPLYKELIGRYTLDPIISDKDKNGILWEDWKSNPQL